MMCRENGNEQIQTIDYAIGVYAKDSDGEAKTVIFQTSEEDNLDIFLAFRYENRICQEVGTSGLSSGIIESSTVDILAQLVAKQADVEAFAVGQTLIQTG